jgi:hypothetical protein
MNIGQGLVSSWYRAAMGICLTETLKETKTNGSKDQRRQEGGEKRKRRL